MGPGLLLEQLLGDDAKVVMTLVCGDNYAVENLEAMIGSALEKSARPDRIYSSPDHAFKPAAMGWRQGALCSAVQSKLGIPVVTGMSEENPGVDLYQERLFTSSTPA